MRYFRITLNPLDPFVQGGSVLLRMPFYLSNTMFYSTFTDGCYVRVPDQEMGVVGPGFDTLMLGGHGGPLPEYKMFQDSALPQGAVEADIPLWSAQAVPLAQPPEPMPQPTAWPTLGVVVGPE